MDQVKKAINDSRGARWTVLVMVSLLMFATATLFTLWVRNRPLTSA